MYLPVISEMRRPEEYRKAAILTGFLVCALYICFSLVIYRYCGIWIAIPVYGSAGILFKKVCYGLALPGKILARRMARTVRHSLTLLHFTFQVWQLASESTSSESDSASGDRIKVLTVRLHLQRCSEASLRSPPSRHTPPAGEHGGGK